VNVCVTGKSRHKKSDAHFKNCISNFAILNEIPSDPQEVVANQNEMYIHENEKIYDESVVGESTDTHSLMLAIQEDALPTDLFYPADQTQYPEISTLNTDSWSDLAVIEERDQSVKSIESPLSFSDILPEQVHGTVIQGGTAKPTLLHLKPNSNTAVVAVDISLQDSSNEHYYLASTCFQPGEVTTRYLAKLTLNTIDVHADYKLFAAGSIFESSTGSRGVAFLFATSELFTIAKRPSKETQEIRIKRNGTRTYGTKPQKRKKAKQELESDRVDILLSSDTVEQIQ